MRRRTMKKLAIAVVIGLLAVCLFGTTVLADDPITVNVVVLGDDPTVTVEADGEGATIYINGQDIQQPTVYKYRIENSYNDAMLKEDISELEMLLEEAGMNLTVTSDGLAKVILVIGEHTSNLRELLGMVTQNEEDSVSRDNELATREENQELSIFQLAESYLELENSFNDYKVSASESLSDIEADNQVAISALSTKLDAQIDVVEELQASYNAKLAWTWGSVGVFGLLLLGIWRVWQIRLRRD